MAACSPAPIVLCSTGSVSRPIFEISKDQLEYFVGYELTCPDIAEAVGELRYADTEAVGELRYH